MSDTITAVLGFLTLGTGISICFAVGFVAIEMLLKMLYKRCNAYRKWINNLAGKGN